MAQITMYTDGSALGNPGPGGYGVVLMSGPYRKEISAGYRLTTNNRMELLAVIVGLEALKADGNDVTIYSDSKYVIDGLSKGWAASWRAKGWKKSDGSKVLNVDLWEMLEAELSRHKVEFVWVRGHNGHDYNERCDELATSFADSLTDDV